MENKRLNEPDYIQELVALIRSNRSAKAVSGRDRTGTCGGYYSGNGRR